MHESKRPRITVVGLGPGRLENLTIAALQSLKSASRVLVRTSLHPTASELPGQGVAFETLDEMYQDADDFEAVYREMAARIIEVARDSFEAGETGGVVYAVPGSPYVGERSVQLLMETARQAGVDVQVMPGVSFIESLCSNAEMSMLDGVQIVDALSIEHVPLNTGVALIIPQIYDRMVAGRVKSRLLQAYSDEHPVMLAKAAGTAEERLEHLCLYEVDRVQDIDHLTTLVVPAAKTRVDVKGLERAATAFAELVSVMATLRSDTGCPWDREQTHQSLMKHMIEETYEALETIDNGDMDKLCEELGDVMLQVVFHAQIAQEDEEFDVADVAASIVKKLMRRHPHVFGETHLDSSDAVLRNWEKIKAVERGEKDRFSRVFEGVPVALPSLMKAEIVQSKASKVGFDWQDFRPAFDKVEEETEELKEALNACETEPAGKRFSGSVKEEIGDLLFAVVNVARLLSIDPEDALKKTVDKFMRRFRYIEERAAANGVAIDTMTLEDMDRLWEESKEVLDTDTGDHD